MWDFPFSILFRVFFCFLSYFLLTKYKDSLNLKRHSSFQNWNNRNDTQIFASRPLIYKLQQEVLQLSDTCVSWSSSKTDLVKKKFNPENRSFENMSIVTFNYLKVTIDTFWKLRSSGFDIPLLNNLHISFLNQSIFLTEFKKISIGWTQV